LLFNVYQRRKSLSNACVSSKKLALKEEGGGVDNNVVLCFHDDENGTNAPAMPRRSKASNRRRDNTGTDTIDASSAPNTQNV
jgi:hypothetical protein